MFQIKKILLALVALALIFPLGAEAACICDPLGIFCIPPGCGGSSSGGFSLSSVSSMGLPAGTIFGIVENIAYWILGLLAFFGIIGFTVAGIMYLVSAGNDEMITKAKKYMLYSIVGVIVGLMGLVILQAAYWMLGGTNTVF